MLKCLTFRPYLDVEPICRPRYMRGAIIIWNVPPMSWAPAFSLGVVVILTNHCCHLPRQVHTMLFHTQAPKNVNVRCVALYKGVGSNENWYAMVHKSHVTVKFVDIMGFPAIHLLIISLIRQWPHEDLVIEGGTGSLEPWDEGAMKRTRWDCPSLWRGIGVTAISTGSTVNFLHLSHLDDYSTPAVEIWWVTDGMCFIQK